MAAKAAGEEVVKALLKLIDRSDGSLTPEDKSGSEQTKLRRAKFKNLIDEAGLRKVENGRPVDCSASDLFKLSFEIMQRHALPQFQAGSVQTFYSRGSSILNPGWLREIGYQSSPGIRTDGEMISISRTKPSTPLHQRPMLQQDSQNVPSKQDAIFINPRTKTSPIESASDSGSIYLPSSASKKQSNKSKKAGKSQGKQRAVTNANEEGNSANVPDLKRGQGSQSELHLSKKRQKLFPTTACSVVPAISVDRDDHHPPILEKAVANFTRIGVDQNEIQDIMVSVFSIMKTLAEDIFEKNGLKDSTTPYTCNKPSEELERLYQRVFGVGNWKEHLARLSFLQVFQGWPMLLAIISTFQLSTVYGKEVPWTTPTDLKAALNQDEKYLAETLRLFDVSFDEVVHKSYMNKTSDLEFQNTVIKSKAMEIRRELTLILREHFDAVLRQKSVSGVRMRASATWMNTWNPMMDEILTKALILKAKMKVSPEGYATLSYKRGARFDCTHMEAVSPGPRNSEISKHQQLEVAMTLCYGVVAMPYEGRPMEVLVKAKVLLIDPKTYGTEWEALADA